MIRSVAALAVLSCLASGQTIFVDDSAIGAADGSSWADAFPDLQSALAVAGSGAQVWVCEGTYAPAPPGGDRALSFVIGTGVQVYGGFAGTEATLGERAGLFATTVLTGDLDGDDQPGSGDDDNSYHVVRIGAGTSNAVLDGFRVTAGNADGPGPVDRSGGGLFSTGGVTVRNTAFVDNEALRWAGRCTSRAAPRPSWRIAS